MIEINDYIKKAKKTGYALTNFLDLHQSSELKKFKEQGLKIFYFGGFSQSERVRAFITFEEEPLDNDFAIDVLKFLLQDVNKINHRQVLGTILSLGLKREVIGDIIFTTDAFYVFVDHKVSEFIINNIAIINHEKVVGKITSFNEDDIKENVEETNINISSLRLDAIIAHTLKMSRNKAQELIEKGNVSRNHLEILNASANIHENDIISIRHFGRIEIGKTMYITKKNRLVVNVKIKH